MTNTMVINEESTKLEIVAYIGALLPTFKASLKTKAEALLQKFSVNPRNVKKAELLEIVTEDKTKAKEVADKSKGGVVAVKAEHKLKPKAKKAAPAKEEDEEDVEEAPAPKKKATLKPAKPAAKKVAKEEAEEEAPKKKIPPYDKVFPKTLKVEGMTLKRADVDFKGAKKLNEEAEIFFATVWPQKIIKDYAKATGTMPPKEGFTNGLDLSQAILFNDTVDRVFASSVYTEAMTYLYAENFEKGEEGFMLAGGLPFAVYVSESEDEEE